MVSVLASQFQTFFVSDRVCLGRAILNGDSIKTRSSAELLKEFMHLSNYFIQMEDLSEGFQLGQINFYKIANAYQLFVSAYLDLNYNQI